MMNFVLYVIVVALLAAFVITLCDKWGVIEWVQVHGNRFFAKMFHCQFCLSWWVAVVLSVIMAAISGNPLLLLVPFCSTMLTRFFL